MKKNYIILRKYPILPWLFFDIVAVSFIVNNIWFASKWKQAVMLNHKEDTLPNFIISL